MIRAMDLSGDVYPLKLSKVGSHLLLIVFLAIFFQANGCFHFYAGGEGLEITATL